MERLTFEGNFCDIAVCQEPQPCKYHDTGCSQKQVWDRLKQYEDVEQFGSAIVFLTPISDQICEAMRLVAEEREKTVKQFGDQSGANLFERLSVLGEEHGELCEAVNATFLGNQRHPERGGLDRIQAGAVQVAAVAVSIVEATIKRMEDADHE